MARSTSRRTARSAGPPGPQNCWCGIPNFLSRLVGRARQKRRATDAWSALQAVQALDWGPTTSPIVGSALYIDTAGTVALILSHAPVRASKQSERAKGLVYSVEGVWRLGEAMEVTLRTILPTNSSASAHPLPRRRRGARRRHTGGTQQRSRGVPTDCRRARTFAARRLQAPRCGGCGAAPRGCGAWRLAARPAAGFGWRRGRGARMARTTRWPRFALRSCKACKKKNRVYHFVRE